jgi:DNA-binding NtrC family response regulator
MEPPYRGMGSTHTGVYSINPWSHTDSRYITFAAAYSLPRMTKLQSSPIVAIDDDAEHLAYVTALVTRMGRPCLGFATAREAIAFMKANRVELVITDIFMPDMDGFELLRALSTTFPQVPVVTLSGEGRMTKDFYLECAQHLGAVAALRKPFDPDALRRIVEQFAPRDAVATRDHQDAKQPSAGENHS